MDSPGDFAESPLDQEDVVYPCKGCGEILEEGKAFELAGNRWHINCFRCNTCGTLLDSDANLLLLGDGSLICNNCTYSCNACGNKIEDLAILTGDQAFCASCFRCRNCKRKIENLRYARTSQGIFCMSCHESLMARRRKKAKTSKQAPSGVNGAAPVLDKSLPALPPNAVPSSSFTPDMDTPPSEAYSETPTEQRSPRERQRALKSKRDASSNNLKRDVSPLSDETRQDPPTLPASTYNDKRSSAISQVSEDGDDRSFIPMAFDPTPQPGPPPMSIKRRPVQDLQETEAPKMTEGRPPRDYFSGRLSAKSAQRDAPNEEKSTRSVSTEREASVPQSGKPAASSPHIADQFKGRTPGRKRDTSGNNTPLSSATSPNIGASQERPERPKPQQLNTGSYTLHQNDGFKLQEVPKTRKSGSRRSSKDETRSQTLVSPIETALKNSPLDPVISSSPISVDTPNSGVNPFDDPKLRKGSPGDVAPPPRHADRPARGDSLAASVINAGTSGSNRNSPEPPTPTTTLQKLGHERNGSASSVPSFVDAQSTLSRGNSSHKPGDAQDGRSSMDVPVAPPRNSSRPTAPSKSVANDDFIAPRAPPPPPPTERHRNNESISTLQSDFSRSERSPALRSTGLPMQSAQGDFSMEEEMARILRGDKSQGSDSQTSVLRRVSNAVKHGRSFSDRGLTSAGKSSINGNMEISSPMMIGSPTLQSPAGKDDMAALKAQLRRAQSRIAELETEKSGMEEHLHNSVDMKQMNEELRGKRSTMAVLDTQREVVIRELETMTDHLQKVKDSKQPFDFTIMKTGMLQDFTASLQKLKDSLGLQIEDLIHKRNELTAEISNLIQMKDKGFQEYEILSSKNNQLLEMNNQLVHNIQDVYKANRVPNGMPLTSFDGGRPAMANGLGIYHPGASKPDTPSTSEVRNLNLVSTDSSMPNLLQETEAEPATILTAPQVVNIRKGGRAKEKFNWSKGGKGVAKNITKGIKGAFASGDRFPTGARDGQYNIDGMPYNHMQTTAGSEQSSLSSASRQGMDNGRLGFFGPKNGGLKAGGLSTMRNGSTTNLTPAENPSVLFGSELEARCDYEKRLVPNIVSRCVEEVEERGMDIEGVYRKSGGSGQVKTIQQGFEKDGTYDISDPDLDIHAVTSALKQYFRKLPTPLITHDVYESLLEAGQLQDREKQASAMHDAVQGLPQHHHETLEFLILHLARVMAHESENLMTPLNLAVVFAPTIMRPLSIEREMTDMQAQRMAVQCLLENNRAIFGTD